MVNPEHREIPEIRGPLHVMVLAAGAGTRMKSDLPKVLHTVGGIPMLGHVVATAHAIATGKLVVVLRFEAGKVEAYLNAVAPDAVVMMQDDIPGTGRAVECGLMAVDDGNVVIVSGDVPLLSTEVLAELVAEHSRGNALASILTAVVPHPTGYGRIIRDPATGAVARIVEEKDATPDERAVQEINSGTYIFDVAALRDALRHVDQANAQGEKYLTDVIALLAGQRPDAVRASIVSDTWLVQGVNTPAQLAAVNGEYVRRTRASQAAQVGE